MLQRPTRRVSREDPPINTQFRQIKPQMALFLVICQPNPAVGRVGFYPEIVPARPDGYQMFFNP